uniref:Uncharacterized protein n=1 Tax=Variovorax sp. HH01 TaxID=1084736 RepID=I3PCP5_9BURK|nr:hypothetical protein var075 [Variovorax sp. HH01]
MIFAVLATGPSLSQAVVNSVQNRVKVVAVSDAYRLAPWADALASTDFSWWRQHPEAAAFNGRKFSGMVDYQNVEGVEKLVGESATNSGLLGVKVAVLMGATVVLLCGFDLHSPGEHFFGRHGGSLRSTTPQRMEVFKRQFELYQPRGVQIINCTPGSALHVYPTASLDACLAESALHGS